MNNLEAVFTAVADTSWRASCLILLVFALRRWLRGRVAARLLFWFWLAVGLRLLLPGSVATTWSPFNLARWNHAPEVALVPVAAPEPASRAEAAAGTSSPGSGASEAPVSSVRLYWIQWAALVWGSVAGVLLLGRALAWRVFARRVRRSAKPALSAMPPDVARRLQQRGVGVCVSDAVSAPALHGILRPRVLFPRGFLAQLSAAEIRLIIAHELAHAERRDLLADALLHVAAVVHWFNPLAWLAVRAARRDCELACDERVMRGGTEAEREDYGATLLKIVRLTGNAPRTGFGLGVAASRQLLKRRIQMIIANPTFAPARTLLCAALLAVITASSFTSETRAQAATPGAAAVEPAPVASPATAAAPIVYNAEIDRLDHLFPTGVVATVSDRSITVAEVRRYIAPLIPTLQREARTQEEFNGRLGMLQNSAIKDLVNRAVLIRQFHDRRDGEEGKRIPPEYVDNAIADELKKRFEGDREKFLDHLRARNVTLQDYRHETEENIIYNYMRAQERTITGPGRPARTPPAGAADKTIRLRIIQLSRAPGEDDAALLEKAKAVLARFRNGEAFEQLAREFDQSARRNRGGDWGWIGPDDLNPAFRDMAMALRKGGVSEPILLPEGCFLLYAEERR